MDVTAPTKSRVPSCCEVSQHFWRGLKAVLDMVAKVCSGTDFAAATSCAFGASVPVVAAAVLMPLMRKTARSGIIHGID